MELNGDENDINKTADRRTYLLEDNTERLPTLNTTDSNPAPPATSLPCREKCSEFCQYAKCPKYATLSTNILLEKRQCMESCTQLTCPKNKSKTVEECGFAGQCTCTRPSASTSHKECDTQETCPVQSVRGIAKSTDTFDLAAPDNQEHAFPCGLKPTSVVTKSEYYKTPEQMPHLLCPHCRRKIHLLSTTSDKNKPPEDTVIHLSSSQLNACQAKLCIQPTPPISCPVERWRVCSHCQTQLPVCQTCAAPSINYFQPTTCPYFQLNNSPCDVTGAAADVSMKKRKPRKDATAGDFVRKLSTCQVCGHNKYLSNQHNKQSSRHHSSDKKHNAQFKIKEHTSTMVLYMEPNFSNPPSMSRTNLSYDYSSRGMPNCSTRDLDSADTFVCALKKLTVTARELLEKFENAMKNKERQRMEYKMKQKYSTLKMSLPQNMDMPVGGQQPMKFIIPLKIQYSSKKKSQQDSVSIILTPMILPQTSNSRK